MRAHGYECGKCGYEPTQKELDNGTCPQCKPPPPPSVRTALFRALRALGDASGHLCDPDTEEGSADDVMLQTFIERLRVIQEDVSAEFKKREAA